MTIIPAWMVQLKDMDPGAFVHEGAIGFKSEYCHERTQAQIDLNQAPRMMCFNEAGEYAAFTGQEWVQPLVLLE